MSFSGDASGATPCADAETEDPLCSNDHPFTVPGGNGIDNGPATVTVLWGSPASDWDMKVFRDSDGAGTSEGEQSPLGSSAQGTTAKEETTIARPGLRPGRYFVRVTNFAAVESYEGAVTFGKTQAGSRLRVERYTLTCRASAKGRVLYRRKIRVDRGRVARIDLRESCSR